MPLPCSADSLQVPPRQCASLVVEDQSQIPSEYVRTKKQNEPNKVAIKVALERGVEIGGVRLVQSISLIRK